VRYYPDPEGRPGVRIDADGRPFFSSAWLNEDDPYDLNGRESNLPAAIVGVICVSLMLVGLIAVFFGLFWLLDHFIWEVA
jgi:hypothetical protein